MLDDSVILNDIKIMSEGKLTLNIDKVREENLFEMLYRERKKLQPVQGERERDRNNGGGKHRHQKPFNKNKNRRRRD